MLENIKETLVKGLHSTTYEQELIKLSENIDNEDEKCLLLLEGESDAYVALLSRHFPEVEVDEIISAAIIKANNEVNGEVIVEDYKLAA